MNAVLFLSIWLAAFWTAPIIAQGQRLESETSGTEASEGETGSQTLGLATPTCSTLPFSPEQLFSHLERELSLLGAVLTPAQTWADQADDGRYESGPDWVLVYGPQHCARLDAIFDIRWHHRREQAMQAEEIDLSSMSRPLLARALALGIADSWLRLQESRASRTEGDAASDPERADSSSETSTDQVGAIEAADVEPGLDASEDSTSRQQGPLPEVDDAQSEGMHVDLRLAGMSRNSPDTGAILVGLLSSLVLHLSPDLPLRLTVDGVAVFGDSDRAAIGWFELGLGVALDAEIADEMQMHFGPRFGIGHAFLPGNPDRAVRVDDQVQMSVGLIVGADWWVEPGLAVTAGAEISTMLLGLEYMTGAGRTGVVGAYWGLSLGVAFR